MRPKEPPCTPPCSSCIWMDICDKSDTCEYFDGTVEEMSSLDSEEFLEQWQEYIEHWN